MPNRAEQNMPITLKPMLKQNRACVPFVGRFWPEKNHNSNIHGFAQRTFKPTEAAKHR